MSSPKSPKSPSSPFSPTSSSPWSPKTPHSRVPTSPFDDKDSWVIVGLTIKESQKLAKRYTESFTALATAQAVAPFKALFADNCLFEMPGAVLPESDRLIPDWSLPYTFGTDSDRKCHLGEVTDYDADPKVVSPELFQQQLVNKLRSERYTHTVAKSMGVCRESALFEVRHFNQEKVNYYTSYQVWDIVDEQITAVHHWNCRSHWHLNEFNKNHTIAIKPKAIQNGGSQERPRAIKNA